MQRSKIWTPRDRRIRRAGSACAMLAVTAVSAVPSAVAGVDVVATSKPVHALVASVMNGTGTPTVLVGGSASPHSYAMKPSDAKAVAGARLLFRISESLEPFTAKLVKSLPKSVQVVTLITAPGLELLPRRESGAFEGHGGHTHDTHGHGAKGKAAEDEHDAHVWLDPANAVKLVDHIATVLAAADPVNAATYAANATATKGRIDALAVELERQLKPAAGKPFVVLHDAYQYLERRFGLTAAGSIAVTPEAAPSGKRLTAIRKKIADSKATCVFAEPGMQPKVVAAVVEGTPARVVLLDPEATQLAPGAGLYGDLMQGLATAITSCLAPR